MLCGRTSKLRLEGIFIVEIIAFLYPHPFLSNMWDWGGSYFFSIIYLGFTGRLLYGYAGNNVMQLTDNIEF